MDMRQFNGGHSTAGKAGRKKTLKDEKLRRKPRTFSLNDFEYIVAKAFIDDIKSNHNLNLN